MTATKEVTATGRSLDSRGLLRSVLGVLVATGSLLASTVAIAEEPAQQAALEIVLDPPAATAEAILTASRTDLGPGADEVRHLTADGNAWRLEGPHGSRWRIEVDRTGYWAPPQDVTLGDGAGRMTLRLIPTGRLVGGLTVPDGEAMPETLGARFETAPSAPGTRRIEGTVTCPVEEARFRCELPAGVFDLRLRAPTFVSHYRWDERIEAGGERSLGRLALEPGASVVGWVEVATGRLDPERCEVRLEPLGGMPTTVTSQEDRDRWSRLALAVHPDERGFFHLEGVPVGQYALVATYPGLAPARRAPVPVSERAETTVDDVVRMEPPQTLEIVVDPATDPGGEPWRLRLGRIDEYSRVLEGADEVDLAPDGWHRWDNLSPGEYDVSVRDTEGATRWKETVRVDAGPNLVQAEIPIVRVRGSVRVGREPIAATLVFMDYTKGRRVALETDDDGRFETVLPREGAWDVRITNRDAGIKRSLPGVEVEVSDSSGWATLDLRVPNTRLRGQVVDEQGRPALAGLAVANLGEELMGRTTEEDGTFEIRGLAPGTVEVYAEAADASRRSDLQLVTLTEDLEGAPVRLVLRERIHITGEVISPAGPVPGARVELVAAGMPGRFSEAVVTDVRGQFEVELLGGTRAVLGTVEPPGFALASFRSRVDPQNVLTIPVESAAGELTIELPEAAGPLFGKTKEIVVLHEGDWLPIETLSRWASFLGTRSQSPTEMTVPQVEPGRYLACLVPPDRLSELVSAEPAGDPACASGYLSPGGALHLEVPEEREGAGGSDAGE